jgi:hypothetical protein
MAEVVVLCIVNAIHADDMLQVTCIPAGYNIRMLAQLVCSFD